MAPPPSTTSDAGTDSAWIAPRLVQYGVPARPGIGGIDGADPVLTTSAREATYVVPATSTLRGPTMRPRPRTSRPPLPVNRSAATVSSQVSVASARMRCATGAQSGVTVGVAREPVDAAGLGEGVGGPDHHLAGDTAPVRALAADELGLDADHVQAGLGEPSSDVLPARTQAQDDDVRSLHAPTLGPNV